MGEEAGGVVGPGFGDVEVVVDDVGGENGMGDEEQPVSDEDAGEGEALGAWLGEGEEEEEGVAESHLRERVLECPIGDGTAEAVDENAEDDEEEGSPAGMEAHFPQGLATRSAAGEREGEGDADHEGEGGVDEIVQGASGPGGVPGVVADGLPEGAVGEFFCDVIQLEQFQPHEKHDEAAQGVQGGEPRGTFRGSGSVRWHHSLP